ncbi:MAG TPA: cation-translocating P-type ATPase [candidate division Zixibacteria bacterium]|nr:cation-translocating P-type ATPase [candidate division Zixibacteria bacterium]
MLRFPPEGASQVSGREQAGLSWYRREAAEVVEELGTDAERGLTAAEALRRLARYGPNELQESRKPSPWTILARQFKNVLVVILISAIALSAALGHDLEAAAIGAIVVLAVLLGFFQEFRAEKAVETLRRMAAPKATVVRDGQVLEIPARDLVPGDIVLVRMGDKVPGDARLIEAVNLRVEEAALTGESAPVEKQSDALRSDALSAGDQTNMIFAGTAVTYGRGKAVVVATAMETEFGRIARLLQTIEPAKTPLQRNLDRVGRALAQAAIALVLIVVGLAVLRGQPLIEMLIFGIALAVAVVPEALPAVVTISLAIGVQRMVRRNALIRRLPAVETLGSVSVICSDKTGTLTRDEMTVRRIFVDGKLLEVSGSGYEPKGAFSCGGAPAPISPPLDALLRAAALASDAALIQSDNDSGPLGWQIRGDPTEGALVVAAAKAGLWKADLEARYPRIHEIPFTSESKRMTTLHAAPEGIFACAKGAPEVILGSCTCVATASGHAPLDPAVRDGILRAARAMAGDALRVLGVAFKPAATPQDAERDMVFLGLVGMIDPPRPEVAQAIERCERAGVKPVMITGDHPVTAEAVAREINLLKDGRVLTGAELDALGEAEFESSVETVSVYARVSPAHKLRIVTALQRKGHVVAMTGDGVNDAPALKKADIGIAMGITGTDVSREAAAMTLLDDNFASIVAAVDEGRRIFNNIKKYLMYLLSSNIGEIGLMLGAVVLDLPLPLTAAQILYVNLATDGLPALALAVDPPEADLMSRPPRNPRAGIFTRPVLVLMSAGGLWSAMANLLLFRWLISSGRPASEAMAMIFVSLVAIEFFKAYNFRSDRLSAFARPFANRWLNAAVLAELALLALIVYLPVLQLLLGTFDMRESDWLVAIGVASTITPVLELTKRLARRGWFGELD